jgi:eukaryotic-like serine/threonine-protein kinase
MASDPDDPTDRSKRELTTPDTLPARDPGALADATAATLAELLPGASRERAKIGRFTVLEVLGTGGMGVVLAAYDPQLDRKVAIKILRTRGLAGARREKEAARLLREARAMAQLSHPHVVTVYDAGTIDDRVFIAMEYIAGKTARGWLNAESRTVDEILDVYIKAGRGLAAGHAAGMVHRDFKPDNVLVGDDGRVCVIDFGLARPTTRQTGDDESEPTPTPNWSNVSPESMLTTAGLLFGTPAYMSPEQHRKAELDARADQFSFCAALFEALYRRMPFKANTYPELAAKVHDGKIDRPEDNPQIPGRVTAAILRGLRPHPDDRFASMDALLDALSPPASRRRGLVIASMALGAAAAVAITLGVTRMRAAHAGAACEGGEARLAGIWDAPARQRVRDGLLASKRRHAAETSRRVADELDRYTADWVARRREVCEATEVRHEQSSGAFDLRMQCFTERLASLRALTSLYASADAAIADNALTAARHLPATAECVTLAPGASPPSPLQRGQLVPLRRELAEARVDVEAGKYLEAVRRLQALRGFAKQVGYTPFEAEVAFWIGVALSGATKPELAEPALRDALATAARSKQDEFVARAETMLIWVNGYQLGHYAEAVAMQPLASAAIARADGGPEMESQLLYHMGSTYTVKGAHQQAADAFAQAIALRTKAFGENDPALFILLSALGGAQLHASAVFPAKTSLDKALALGEKTLGPAHPDIANLLGNLGALAQAFGNFDEAIKYQQRALALREEVVGPDHLDVGLLLYGLGVSYNGREDFRTALPYYQRALAIFEKLGPEHPQVGLALVGVADCLEEIGRAPDAVPPGERALAVVGKTTSDPVQLAMARFILAKALWSAGREHPRAHALAVQAREGFVSGGLGAMAGTIAVDKWLVKTKGQP